MSKPTKPDETLYLWENIPRELMDAAKVKMHAQTPPLTLKGLLTDLLAAWTYGSAGRLTPALPRKVSKKLPTRPPPPPPEEPTADPDLGF